MIVIGLLRGAGECCQAIATAIFDQLEEPVISLWFSPAWEKKETVVENLLITFSDFFVDFQKWISGGFFFPKIVQFCLTKYAVIIVHIHLFTNFPSCVELLKSTLYK